MNLNYYLPLLSVIIANICYHNISKNQPQSANAFLILGVAYVVSAIMTLMLYFLNHGNLKTDVSNLNYTSILLGIAIVGIELGYILLYRNGWTISTAALIANVTVAILLFIIGFLFYKETISVSQLIGTVLCLSGILLIKLNK